VKLVPDIAVGSGGESPTRLADVLVGKMLAAPLSAGGNSKPAV
jgi:hypothetical protein